MAPKGPAVRLSVADPSAVAPITPASKLSAQPSPSESRSRQLAIPSPLESTNFSNKVNRNPSTAAPPAALIVKLVAPSGNITCHSSVKFLDATALLHSVLWFDDQSSQFLCVNDPPFAIVLPLAKFVWFNSSMIVALPTPPSQEIV